METRLMIQVQTNGGESFLEGDVRYWTNIFGGAGGRAGMCCRMPLLHVDLQVGCDSAPTLFNDLYSSDIAVLCYNRLLQYWSRILVLLLPVMEPFFQWFPF